MFSRLRQALSNPLVVAYTALFVAFSGGSAAYAVATIGSDDIIDNAVLSRHIKGGAVKSSDVGNNSLTGQDIDESSFSTGPRKFEVDVPYTLEPYPGTWVPMATLGNVTLLYRCPSQSGATNHADIGLSATTDGVVNAAWTTHEPGDPSPVVPRQDGFTFSAQAMVEVVHRADEPGTNPERAEGQMVIQSGGGQVTTVTFHFVSNNGRCQFVGTAIAATS